MVRKKSFMYPITVYLEDEDEEQGVMYVSVDLPDVQDIEDFVMKTLDEYGVKFSDLECEPSEYGDEWECEVFLTEEE